MATTSENNPKLGAFILSTIVSLAVTASGLVLAGVSFAEKYATKDYVENHSPYIRDKGLVLQGIEDLKGAVSRIENLLLAERRSRGQ